MRATGRATLRAVSALVLAVLAAPAARAGPVMIGPLRLDLGPRQRIASVTLTNRGPDTMNFQAEVLAWTQGADGDQHAPSEDIVVSPPISELPPGRAQIFRVAVRQPPPPGPERAYRVVLTDVTPSAPAPGGAPAVNFRIAHSVPLYVTTAAGGGPSLSTAPCPPEPRLVCVRVLNAGAAHDLIRRVTFQSGSWSQSLTSSTVVLAGGETAFRVVRPPGLDRGAVVQVRVEGERASARGAVGSAAP